MKLFRNQEVKQIVSILTVISAAAVTIGFVLDLKTGILATIICSVLCSVFFVFTKKRYKNIAFLCEQIDMVLHGNEALAIDMCKEGELSILQSEIYKMTIMLKEHSESLIKEKRHLSDSIADIAHQLRTPLTSVNMIVSFLGESDLDTKRRLELTQDLTILLSRIDWLITTLLKMSKIDAKTVLFQKEEISVPVLIHKALQPLLIPLELKEIQLMAHGEDKVTFFGDLSWSAEAIGNIIKNCMEHTKRNGIIQINYSQNAIFTEIKIHDNGNGIDKEDLPHLFERFYRGKNASENSFGVGLALSRMIITAQNGTIKVENKSSGGACFTIKYYHSTV